MGWRASTRHKHTQGEHNVRLISNNMRIWMLDRWMNELYRPFSIHLLFRWRHRRQQRWHCGGNNERYCAERVHDAIYVQNAICFAIYLSNLTLFKHNWNFEKKKKRKYYPQIIDSRKFQFSNSISWFFVFYLNWSCQALSLFSWAVDDLSLFLSKGICKPQFGVIV